MDTAYTVDWLLKLDPDSFIEELGGVPKIGVIKDEAHKMALNMLTEEILEELPDEKTEEFEDLLRSHDIEKIKKFLFPTIPNLENKFTICYFSAKKMLLLSELRIMEIMKMVGHEDEEEIDKYRIIIDSINKI